MNIIIIRKEFTAISTIGEMLLDGQHFYVTLEDAVRDEKISGMTAIPYGTYEVIINKSMRFKKDMPLLLNVPGFSGIRIHSGNTSADTEGCILIGTTKGKDSISGSRQAFAVFMRLLQAGLKTGKVLLTIVKGVNENETGNHCL
jgi:hypothetical protein